jgi:O-antigen ligase
MIRIPQKHHQVSPRYQKFLWLIALALVARVTVFVRKRSIEEFTSVDVDTLVDLYAASEIILVCLGILAILLSPGIRKTLNNLKSSSIKYLIIYYLMCLMSVFWSYFAKYTMFRAVEMIMIVTLLFVCMSYYQDFISAERVYLYISMIVILFGIFMHLKLASWQISLSRLHTNQFSAVAAMAFVYCLGERVQSDGARKKFLTKLALLFGFFTVLGTSATSNIAAFAGVLTVLVIMRRSKVEIVSFMFIGLIVLYWLGYFEEFWMDILFPGKSEHDILTLKGRKHLWNVYIRLIGAQPILGYGFGTVSRMGFLWGAVSTTHAHNGFLEVLLGAGLAGGAFFFLWLLRVSAEMMHAYKINKMGIIGSIGAFTVALINNMGRSMMGGSFDAPSAVFLILIALFTCHIRVQASTHVPAKDRVPIHQGRKRFLNVRPFAPSRTTFKSR